MRVLRVYHGGRDPAHRLRDEALRSAGVDVTTVVPVMWDERADATPVVETLHTVELPVRRSGDVNRHRYRDTASLRRLLTRLQPDILDLHEEPFSAVTRQWLSVVPAALPIVGYSAQNIDKRWPPPFAQWEKRALQRIGGMYPCSRQAASVLRGKGYTGQIEVLPLGVDTQLMRPGSQRHDDAVWTLLMVGRLVPEKGVCDAVEVLTAVLPLRAARLVIAGQGPEAVAAADLARSKGVAHAVEVMPWVDAGRLAELYREAHVVLLPSRTTRTWVEQFGRVITEGQASGAVVVGYASGSIPEVGAGLITPVPEGDVAALGTEVRRVMQDENAYRRLRSAGIARTAQVSWEAVAERQAGLYRSVLEAAPKRLPLQPDRRAAVAQYGPPAEVAGGGRPFALPLLREDRPWTRTLAAVVDAAVPPRSARGGLQPKDR